ncbi:hypothetical protein KFK09_026685 [Dendrobium nobile]|uniref:Uncharacterized protein n=1 Tax=Dendrobium nobile TaxID=94219 RepID=A0A8T3A8T0_DENNO|nr:hypothetical protein KFK09_026685 [Dendrobium nobile]
MKAVSNEAMVKSVGSMSFINFWLMFLMRNLCGLTSGCLGSCCFVKAMETVSYKVFLSAIRWQLLICCSFHMFCFRIK